MNNRNDDYEAGHSDGWADAFRRVMGELETKEVPAKEETPCQHRIILQEHDTTTEE